MLPPLEAPAEGAAAGAEGGEAAAPPPVVGERDIETWAPKKSLKVWNPK